MAHTATTGAVVSCKNARFESLLQPDDPESVTMDIEVTFNGVTGWLGDTVTFVRRATSHVKQGAVRAKVNLLLETREPGVVLGSAAIQIVGLPV